MLRYLRFRGGENARARAPIMRSIGRAWRNSFMAGLHSFHESANFPDPVILFVFAFAGAITGITIASANRFLTVVTLGKVANVETKRGELARDHLFPLHSP